MNFYSLGVEMDFWGRRELAVGEVTRGRLAGSILFVQRLPRELRFRLVREDRGAGGAKERWLSGVEFPEEGALYQRHVFRQSPAEIRITPALADRAVVVRPVQPVIVGAKEEACLYVSSQLWLQVWCGGGLLFELPSATPMETWFGSDTRDGEICYALETRARGTLDNVAVVADRALTELNIVNHTAAAMVVSRVRLPVTALGLFRSHDGWLHTEAVSLVQEEEGHWAKLRVSDAPTAEGSAGFERVARPRQPSSRGSLVRAFSELFRES